MDDNGLLLHLEEESDKEAACAGVEDGGGKGGVPLHLQKSPPKVISTLFSGNNKTKQTTPTSGKKTPNPFSES